MRRYILGFLSVMVLAGSTIFIPGVRSRVKAIVRPEAPPQLTPLAVTVPQPVTQRRSQPTARPEPTATAKPPATTRPASTTAASAQAITEPTATLAPSATAVPPTPTTGPIEVNGRVYDAYIPAATKKEQAYQYSCEFDAAWVILQTYGIDASVDQLIDIVGMDRSVEPTIEETKQGIIIRGGDINTMFSGNIKENFLARATGNAARKAFEQYDLEVTPISDRAGVEAALRAGQLIWIKTTVDFKPWRPATWVMPDGQTRQVVLGNDHAVVVMGFSERGVVIRDVLGPTSSNWNRPYEYEVAWDTFLKAWGAQGFDGLAVAPPSVTQ